MQTANEYESFERVGVEPHRSYYIPFSETDKIKYKHGIVDRTASSRFLSLDGVWQIKAHSCLDEVEINEDLFENIPVPACVQLHGYDQIQYINAQYPFPVLYPKMSKNNPCWHYRRDFMLDKKDGEKYYLDFEGVDSAFYLFVNGQYKGYSQISHATSEFDITDLVKDGENTLDVIVLKWCISSYLECQDKFRFSGIFRNVYILKRPKKHITDYRVITSFKDNDGVLTFKNESKVGIVLTFEKQKAFVGAGKTVEFSVNNVQKWTAETPVLYTLTLQSEGEKIVEKVGFREVCVQGKVFKLNGEAIKLKGVNRHDFNCKTGATVTVENLVQDLKLMKELNVNAVRTSHYPNMPQFYQLCDVFGIYIMNEADVETHGAGVIGKWSEYAEDMRLSPGIEDRDRALVERDKNRSCVIIWSLGNECCFGQAFFKGARYIRRRDKTRPVHYESLQHAPKYYFSKLVDMVSMMYPSLETMKKQVLDNPKETRPFVLCEYTHAMGNSCGDIAAYWDLINANEQCMGGFVWEWADHAIKTKKGFLYGGDFGESEHDGNFCCDGLITADRKLKSAALEMKAVYGGKTKSERKDVKIPPVKSNAKTLEITLDKDMGMPNSIKADGKEVLKTPMRLNILRYTDNDRNRYPHWVGWHKLTECKAEILDFKKKENGYSVQGVLCANCLPPAVTYTIDYTVCGGELTMEISYKIGEEIKDMPRFGVEFGVDKTYGAFAFIGYGKGESYVDKQAACEYGYFENTAKGNYDRHYARPQESGSHYASKYLCVKNLFALTAEKEFSFSVNPYTTQQLCTCKHDFELKENDFVNVCVDLAMSGVGSNSCGPTLDPKYEIPTEGKNTFKFTF